MNPSTWISTKDRLPDVHVEVHFGLYADGNSDTRRTSSRILFACYSVVYVGWYGSFNDEPPSFHESENDWDSSSVSYWMPVPDLP